MDQLKQAQKAAVDRAANRVMIPYPGGLVARVAFAHDQALRAARGEDRLPEEDVLWTTVCPN